MAKSKTTICISIDDTLAQLVKDQAEKENRAVSNMFECILKEYFLKRREIKDGKLIEMIE